MAPVLTVVNGDAQPHMTGLELVALITPTIVENLHRVPRDDPWRASLERLVRSGRHHQRAEEPT